MSRKTIGTITPSSWLHTAFALTLFFSALTGFAQMPIFKRYYIADIPGLGWLAQFYTTYWLHYISATCFLAIASYLVTDYWLRLRNFLTITLFGYVRGALLFFILTTGILLVFRNLPGYRFSPQFVIALNFSHLGLVVFFLLVTLTAFLTRGKWVRRLTPTA